MEVVGALDEESGGQRPERAGSDVVLPDLSRLRLETLLHELIERAGAVLQNEARLHRLLDAVVSIGRSLAYADVIDSTVRAARELVAAEHCGLVVVDADRSVRDVHWTGSPDALDALVPTDPDGTRRLADRLRRLLADDRAERSTEPALLAVPLRVRGEAFGLLCMAGKTIDVESDAEPFGQADEDVASALSAAASIAIENARLYEETARLYEQTTRRERWLTASTEIMAHLLGGATLTTTLDVIADRARDVASCDLALLALLDPTNEHLVIEVTAGTAPDRLVGLATPIQGTSLADVVHSGEPRLYTRDPAAAAWLPGLDTDADLDIELDDVDLARGSALLVPLTVGRLTVGKEPMGVLAMVRTHTANPFDTLDLRLATTFAGHAALALESARARADREEIAVFRDRERIARALHDRVIQRLFGVALGLQGLADSRLRPSAVERVTGYVRDLDGTIAEIRRSVFSLPTDYSGTRRGARLEVLDTIEVTAEPLDLEPRVELIGPIDTAVPDDLLPELLAAVREGLSTAVERGARDQVHLIVTADPEQATLTVRVDAEDTEDGKVDGRVDSSTPDGRFAVEPTANGGIALVWRTALPV